MLSFSSPPWGPVQAASGAANGWLVIAARASDRETVNYSSKHGVPPVVRASKTNTERGQIWDKTSVTSLCGWIRRSTLWRGRLQLSFPLRRLVSLSGSLRGGMRRVFFLRRREERVPYNREKLGPATVWTLTTSLAWSLLPLFTLWWINININMRCALLWARVARAAAPGAALIRLRKKSTSVLWRREGCAPNARARKWGGAWSMFTSVSQLWVTRCAHSFALR